MKKKLSKFERPRKIKKGQRDKVFQIYVKSLMKIGYKEEEAKKEARELLGQFTLKAITAGCEVCIISTKDAG